MSGYIAVHTTDESDKMQDYERVIVRVLDTEITFAGGDFFKDFLMALLFLDRIDHLALTMMSSTYDMFVYRNNLKTDWSSTLYLMADDLRSYIIGRLMVDKVSTDLYFDVLAKSLQDFMAGKYWNSTMDIQHVEQALQEVINAAKHG